MWFSGEISSLRKTGCYILFQGYILKYAFPQLHSIIKRRSLKFLGLKHMQGISALILWCANKFAISSVQSLRCVWLSNPMDCSTPGLPVHHQLPELAQIRVHWVGDAIQPSHPLSSPSPPTFNLPQHQGLFQRFSSSHQVVAKVLEFQLQPQFFQWIFRTDLL